MPSKKPSPAKAASKSAATKSAKAEAPKAPSLRSIHPADAAYLMENYGPETVPQFVTDQPKIEGVTVWMDVEITGRTIQHVIGGGPSVRVQVTVKPDPGSDDETWTVGGWMTLENGFNMVEKF